MKIKIYKQQTIEVPKLNRKHKHYYSEKETIRLINLYNKGKSYKQISKIMNKSISALRSKICRIQEI